jgi:hypothetical protein
MLVLFQRTHEWMFELTVTSQGLYTCVTETPNIETNGTTTSPKHEEMFQKKCFSGFPLSRIHCKV